MNQPVIVEKLINDLNANVYPITIIKFVLNKGKILSYFEKAASDDFKIKTERFKIDNKDCEFCKDKRKQNIANLCRQHTSLKRVLDAKEVLYDEDTECYIYKNEIFRVVNNRLVIVYCPHTKSIVGNINDSNVRKITPLTIEDDSFEGLPDYDKITVLSTTWMNTYLRCWFNDEFSIITVPHDRYKSNFVLKCNQ